MSVDRTRFQRYILGFRRLYRNHSQVRPEIRQCRNSRAFGFHIISLYVCQAFAQCMTFEEFSALTGIDLREVQLDVPKAELELLMQITGFEQFSPATEALILLKPMPGLNEVRRARRKKLHQVFIQWGSCRQLYSEPALYCVHRDDVPEIRETPLLSKMARLRTTRVC